MLLTDRNLELRMVRASSLRTSPLDARRLPQKQQQLAAELQKHVALLGVAIARRVDGHKLELVDGHLLARIAGDELIPVVIVDLSDDEAAAALLAIDRIASLAATNKRKLALLTERVALAQPIVAERIANCLPQSSSCRPSRKCTSQTEIPASYHLLVECHDESQQNELFDLLADDGLACRVLSLGS